MTGNEFVGRPVNFDGASFYQLLKMYQGSATTASTKKDISGLRPYHTPLFRQGRRVFVLGKIGEMIFFRTRLYGRGHGADMHPCTDHRERNALP